MAVAVLVVLLLAAALGSCGNTAPPTTPLASGPTVPADEEALDRAAVTARKEFWLAHRPAAYAYTVSTTCSCFRQGTYEVTVEGEQVVDSRSLDAAAERYRADGPPLLDVVFAMLDEPLALAEGGEISTGRASARFDPTFGHPVSWTIAGSDGLPSHHAEVTDFRTLDPTSVEGPPAGLSVVISNQSFDVPDVGLTVTVDDEVVVQRSFAVGSQHTFVPYLLPLAPGDHRIVVTADTGATVERVVTVGAERRFLYVAYGGGGDEPISISESDRAFVFG